MIGDAGDAVADPGARRPDDGAPGHGRTESKVLIIGSGPGRA